MSRFTLAPRADLATYYEADVQRYAPDAPQRQVVTREVFMALYQDCASIGFEHDGRPIGGILFDGLEAHIAVLPQYHGRWALLLKPALDWLFSLRERILVRVDPDNQRCIAFMAHHGWPCLGRVGDSLLYRISHQGGSRKTAYRFGQEPQGAEAAAGGPGCGTRQLQPT
jgi:GNAT superfamily N-acetyltransferase